MWHGKKAGETDEKEETKKPEAKDDKKPKEQKHEGLVEEEIKFSDKVDVTPT